MQGLNTQLRNLGMGSLIEEGCVRRTITAALLDSGLQKPFPLEGVPADLQENLKSYRKMQKKHCRHINITQKI